MFDKKAKDIPLQPRDLVLRWDVQQEDKGKHEKFDPLWFGPFRIAKEREGKIRFCWKTWMANYWNYQ